jgi:hypothetical protein
MVKYALLIGINYRNTENELYGCINDINNMKLFLESKLGYTKFVILTDDATKRSLRPTKSNILGAIRSLVRILKPYDEVWFHYSGHGILEYDRSSDEESGYDCAIAPIDYDIEGCINDDTLRSSLVENIPNKARLYIILDACYSGTGCDLRYKYDDSSYIINKNVISSTYIPSEWFLSKKSYEFEKYPITKGEVFCISGCQDYQESADTFIENEQTYGGVLTHTMLSLFRSNDLKTYMWKNLLNDICCSVKMNGYDQVTALTSGKLLDMESKVFSFPVRDVVKPSIPQSSNKNKRKYIHTENANANNSIKKMIFT